MPQTACLGKMFGPRYFGGPKYAKNLDLKHIADFKKTLANKKSTLHFGQHGSPAQFFFIVNCMSFSCIYRYYFFTVLFCLSALFPLS